MLKLPGTPSREERFYLARSPQRRLSFREQSRRVGPTQRFTAWQRTKSGAAHAMMTRANGHHFWYETRAL